MLTSRVIWLSQLQWNNLNPILNSLISHKLSSTHHEVGFIDVEISVLPVIAIGLGRWLRISLWIRSAESKIRSLALVDNGVA